MRAQKALNRWSSALLLLALIACNTPGATTYVDGYTGEPTGRGGDAQGPAGRGNLFTFGTDRASPADSSEGGAGGAAEPPKPVSKYCGDAIVGGSEECDDGPGDELDGCTADCQTRDLSLTPSPFGAADARRRLGEGRHPVSGGDDGFALAFSQVDEGSTTVGVALFDLRGKSIGVLDVGATSVPSPTPNANVAALPGGKYAVTWSDFASDGSSLGVALLAVAEAGPLGPVASANSVTAFTQTDPDLIWTGSELVVAWVDYSDAYSGPDVRYRRFDQDLNPLETEQTLAAERAAETDVALAKIGGGVAAAYREGAVDGEQSLVVAWGTARYRVTGFGSFAARERPALAELDPTHLLAVFSASVLGGSDDTPQLHYAVIDAEAESFEQLAQPLFSDSGDTPARARSNPALLETTNGVYLAWRQEAASGDTAGEQLWLQHLGWLAPGEASQHDLDTSASRLLVPRVCEGSVGDQRQPTLASTSAGPHGSIVLAWEDYAQESQPDAPRAELRLQYAAMPLQRDVARYRVCSPETPCLIGVSCCETDLDCVAGSICQVPEAELSGVPSHAKVCSLASP